jgi:hypothetical protein
VRFVSCIALVLRAPRFSACTQLSLSCLSLQIHTHDARYAVCISDDSSRSVEAEAMLVENLERKTRVLGAEHPDTLVTASYLAELRLDR